MIKHHILYKDKKYYAGFPHITRDKNGDLLVVFQRSPLEQPDIADGEEAYLNLDSQVCLMRSTDKGKNWSESMTVVEGVKKKGIIPTLPAITVLHDGRYLVRYAQWQVLPVHHRYNIEGPVHRHFIKTGQVGQIYGNGFSVTTDKGQQWVRLTTEVRSSVMTATGLMSHEAAIELSDQTLVMPVYSGYPLQAERSWLLHSWDGGLRWEDPALIAGKQGAYREVCSYNEASVTMLDDTTLLALVRVHKPFTTQDANKAFITEGEVEELEWTVSYDVGFTWEPPGKTGIWGQPARLMKLQDGSLLCSYAYRRVPYGIRMARAEFSPRKGWQTRALGILRADGTGRDIGYPASIQLSDGSIFSVYYIYGKDGIRHIAATHWTLDELEAL